MTRMRVHVSSDSTLRVGVSNPDPPNIWARNLADVWNEHGFTDNLFFGSPRIANHLARFYQHS